MKIEAIKARFESGNQFPVTKALLPKEEFDWLISEIERLQSLATTAMEQHEIVGRLYQESVKEIERLHEEIRTEQRLSFREQVGIQQVEIERLTAEVNEQARLLGGSAERELRMRAVIQQAKAQAATQVGTPPPHPNDGWLHSGPMLYRLTNERNPQNRDEIQVTMADGSRSLESRGRRASELLGQIRAAPPAQTQCLWPTCQTEEFQQTLAKQVDRELVGTVPPRLAEAEIIKTARSLGWWTADKEIADDALRISRAIEAAVRKQFWGER